MIHSNSRCRSVVLALILLVTGQGLAAFISLPAMPAMPTKSQVVGAIALMMYIRLQTKISQDYKLSDWADDKKDLMSSLNVFDSELYEKIAALFDKWCIGRRFKVEPADYRTTEKDGTIVTVKGKKLKCTAFGAMGLFEFYVINSLETLSKIATNLGKTQDLTKGVFGIDLGYVTK